MGGDVLSQSEVESLLSAMAGGGDSSSGGPSGPGAPPPGMPAGMAPGGGGGVPSIGTVTKPRDKIAPYDFKRPERVGKEQMRALQTLHEGFGRNFAASLSALLRSMIEVKLTSVDQLTYSEFVFSLENPTCFNVLEARPLEGNMILDITPSIIYPMIDRLLGGGRESTPLARRPLTEIERRLVARITGLFLSEMQHAWENVMDLELEVVRVESNPQLVQLVPPNEVVVVISFEVVLAEVRGMINLCIPYNSIERISGKLSANSWLTYGRREPSPENVAKITRSLRDTRVEISVRLASTQISTGELIGLRVGDIITTQKDVHKPLLVSIEGIPKFHARPGAYKGHKAIQIESMIEDPLIDAIGD